MMLYSKENTISVRLKITHSMIKEMLKEDLV